MPDRVVFHIGTIKTGTTGLQKFCFEHRDALLEADVDYIQFESPRRNKTRWANGEFFLDNGFDAALVRKRLLESPASTVLISEEGLMPRPHVWQNEVFADMRRTVVLYLRNSVELVASWAAENSRPYNFHAPKRVLMPIAEGIEKLTTTYMAMLAGVPRAFDADPDIEVVIRPFPPPVPGETLIGGFLKTLGIPDRMIAGIMAGHTDDMVNVGHSRKFCDAAYLVGKLAEEFGVQSIYSPKLVRDIAEELTTGDARKATQTLSDAEMLTIQQKLADPVKRLVSAYGAPAGIASLPKPYGTKRPPYLQIDEAEIRRLFEKHVTRISTDTVQP